MQKENIELSFFRAKVHELSAVDKDLIRSAKQYLLHAYAPYSGFLVGSSILLDNGEIINGNKITDLLNLRAEQLSVDDFIKLTNHVR